MSTIATPTGNADTLPAPATRRAGDYVFVSSIHPIDERGDVVRGDRAYVGESEVERQSRRVLDELKRVLENGGSSLDRVLKAEVHLVDAADFPEFKRVWAEFFPQDPPARTTLVVGDTHVHEGARLNLQAVALHESSSHERVAINPNDAPNPLEAEHASWAVRAGELLFVSAFPATDFVSGIPVGKRPGFPNYGNDAEMQALYVVDCLRKVCAAADTTIEQAVKCQFYETDLLNFHDVDRVWGESMGVAPPRSSMACRGFLVPGALFATNCMFLIPDAEHVKEETRKGIRWHPVDVRKVNFSPGITAGPWLFTAGQVAVPDFGEHKWVGSPVGLPHHYSDIEIQTKFTMELLSEQLEANGLGLEDISDARIYLTNSREDYRGFERAWREIFADVERWPTMSLIPSNQADGDTGIMFSGPRIEIDLISRRDDT